MKTTIRENISKQRLSLPEEKDRCLSKEIVRRLEQEPRYRTAMAVLYYLSKKGEVRTHDLVRNALGKKRVIVPKTVREPLGLRLCEISSFGMLRPGMFGILESAGVCDVPPEDIELAIVPGVAFDERGHRIGHGFGYYDRLLAGMRAFKIGLAYDFQVVPLLPAEEHDIKLDMILTEKRVIVP